MENKSENLLRAQLYEDEMIKKEILHRKPIFHFSAPIGWINDPNGFSAYKGEYHLFYQYHPYANRWGPMHWGHAKSKDFVEWEVLPIALAPDQDYDNYGCFSGTALQDADKHIIAYTSVCENEENGLNTIRQTQSIAIGDGINYVKQINNPIIGSDMIPYQDSKEDFRDPKIWKQNDKYYILVANRREDGNGQILKYSSINLKDWIFEGVMFSSEEKIGNMWECPDYFKLDNKQILIISPQDMMAKKLKYHSGNGSIYLVSKEDSNSFEPENIDTIDFGIDFYAPQTLETLDGRRIMIAWMQSWDVPSYPSDFEWCGMMTFPRELTLSDNNIIQNPAKEIENYWENEIIYKDETVCGKNNFAGINGRSIDLTLRLRNLFCDVFEIQLAKHEDTYISIELDIRKGLLTFDRKYTQCIRDIVNERKVEIDTKHNEASLRILLDLYSIEIFIDNGRKVLTSLFFINEEYDEIDFISKNGSCIIDIAKRDIME